MLKAKKENDEKHEFILEWIWKNWNNRGRMKGKSYIDQIMICFGLMVIITVGALGWEEATIDKRFLHWKFINGILEKENKKWKKKKNGKNTHNDEEFWPIDGLAYTFPSCGQSYPFPPPIIPTPIPTPIISFFSMTFSCLLVIHPFLSLS